MTVRSGAAAITLPAEAEDNEDAGGADVSIDLPVRSPVVANFGKTGELKMSAQAQRPISGRFITST
jgi:hypothetical protein